MKSYIILIILLISLPLLFFGIKTVPSECTCQGIGSAYCLGSISCENKTTTCIPLTCESKYDLLGTINSTEESSLSYTAIIIDSSKSMEGENIDATKKAVEEFVKKISTTQNVAIIEFNDKATLLSEFSNDKLALFQNINLISPRGRTKFSDAFAIANNLFTQTPINARKYVIFLSDGAPEDEQEIYMEEINNLKNKQVQIYALTFSGKSSEGIMKNIASKDSNLFLVSSAQDIGKSFVQIYSNIEEEGDIYIQTEQFSNNARNNENIITSIHSLHNNVDILDANEYCPLESTNYIEAKKSGTIFRILGIQEENIIKYPLNGLDAGIYQLVAHSKIFLDDCSLSATKILEDKTIINENDCKITCADINFIMKGETNTSYIREGHQSIAWNIFIDKSSSMDVSKRLDQAIKNTKTILEIIPNYDKVTIGTFDKQVNFFAINKQPKDIPLYSFSNIYPSASTQIISALKKAKELENMNQQTHTIIMSDGTYSPLDEEEARQIITSLQGCISTINYGTHLLTTKEPLYELIKKERKCGDDFITEPSEEELQQLIGSNISTQPELIIQLKREESKEETNTIVINIISSFTGKEPLVTNEYCQLSPLTQLTIESQKKEPIILTGKTFTIEKNTSFTIESSFNNPSCSYIAKKQIIYTPEKKENPLMKILFIVIVVLLVHLIVFMIVMNKKLKKVHKVLKKK